MPETVVCAESVVVQVFASKRGKELYCSKLEVLRWLHEESKYRSFFFFLVFLFFFLIQVIRCLGYKNSACSASYGINKTHRKITKNMRNINPPQPRENPPSPQVPLVWDQPHASHIQTEATLHPTRRKKTSQGRT